MHRRHVRIQIDSNSRRIDYFNIEGFNLNPDQYFRFISGRWVADLPNFPIGPDNDLDILTVAVGNPFTNSTMAVEVDNQNKGSYQLFQPFNRNGYGHFNQHIPI